ncbi:hypothetical protein MHUMG1_08342 [Metarhizium humberi]|uniref:C2H2-type domain-containing protein n=4 Tax=Metarhizium TaxID=5529 RepID=A0A0D9NWL4_METAN|nr:ring-6 [Metarhizium robertsii ARSEF 23]EXU98726.1 hypothetical protein X797_008201 [Metarhizium robertsii]KAH0594019.1 hypothetical protein MHUMG1_08342 [Metarhizium humberi]KJK78173.1 hypothetical protein H634G_06345 [Metarhizium anisopliae BRIP 53293]KJK87874.1 hypothetical protein H633G_08294 [Metarhizium anisopliae BRIP 53284]EFY95534.2 ring-6 [Metarhizium robertsii ARSEF 23]
MGKKKRGHPDIEEVLARPWCYYCERDFEDLKLLISHQKAKHFKCDRCGRRLNTAGGLSVHLNQVHKETLSQVENALPNRQGLEVEIFGMEGIPQDALEQHRSRIIQNFYQAQEDRRIATGNPASGQATPRKKVRVEASEDLLKRLAEFRAQKKAGILPPAAEERTNTPPTEQGNQQQNAAQPTYPGQQAYAYPADSLPARPPSHALGGTGLPQRPPQAGYWQPQGGAAGGVGDDVDQLIRMAEAGVKPQQAQEAEDAGDRKAKKEKKGRMIYDDVEFSPEERMAALPRYAFVPQVGA